MKNLKNKFFDFVSRLSPIHYCACSCHEKKTKALSIDQECNCEHCESKND